MKYWLAEILSGWNIGWLEYWMAGILGGIAKFIEKSPLIILNVLNLIN